MPRAKFIRQWIKPLWRQHRGKPQVEAVDTPIKRALESGNEFFTPLAELGDCQTTGQRKMTQDYAVGGGKLITPKVERSYPQQRLTFGAVGLPSEVLYQLHMQANLLIGIVMLDYTERVGAAH